MHTHTHTPPHTHTPHTQTRAHLQSWTSFGTYVLMRLGPSPDLPEWNRGHCYCCDFRKLLFDYFQGIILLKFPIEEKVLIF